MGLFWDVLTYCWPWALGLALFGGISGYLSNRYPERFRR